MTQLSIGAVYLLARDAGLGHSAAVTATAIAIAESGLDTNAMGDISLATKKWGPSIGLWQIRALNADLNTGRTRDAAKLRMPDFNARAMVAISNKGTNWTPWSVYNSGAYRQHLPAVRQAAAGKGDAASTVPAPKPTRGDTTPPPAPATGGASPVFDVDPLPGGKGLPGYSDDALRGLWGSDTVLPDLRRHLLVSAALVLGVSLVAIGAWRVTA